MCIYISVAELLQDGVDPCGTDNKQRTALHIASARGDEQLGESQKVIK